MKGEQQAGPTLLRGPGSRPAGLGPAGLRRVSLHPAVRPALRSALRSARGRSIAGTQDHARSDALFESLQLKIQVSHGVFLPSVWVGDARSVMRITVLAAQASARPRPQRKMQSALN